MFLCVNNLGDYGEKKELSDVEKNILLSVENISISFSRSYKKDGEELTENKSVLKNISLQLNEGEIVALMGGNGSGKTTLFNIISGLINQDTGKVIFKGKDITNWQAYKRASAGIGRLFQDNHIFPNITVLENMCLSSADSFGEIPFVSLLKKRKNDLIENERKMKAVNILEELFEGSDNNLLKNKDKLAGELSYGEKRLLGFARIFMGGYDLVLLDEPSAGVNGSTISNILGMVNKLSNTNVTVFLIEHEKQFVNNIADRVIYIKDKKIVFNDNPNIVLSKIGMQ